MNKQQQIKATRILFGIVFVISTFLLLTLWSSENVPWLVKSIFILVMLISASMAFLNPEKSKQQIEQIKLEITRKLEELKAKKELSNRKISVTFTQHQSNINDIDDEYEGFLDNGKIV